MNITPHFCITPYMSDPEKPTRGVASLTCHRSWGECVNIRNTGLGSRETLGKENQFDQQNAEEKPWN